MHSKNIFLVFISSTFYCSKLFRWYALRAKTSTTKKKAKYRGEMLIRTTFVFRSDALTGTNQSQSSGSKKGLTPLGTDLLRKSATNLALSLKKSSFREKGHPDSEDKRNSTALATEDGNSRQRLSRSHSLAALTVALKRASFGRKSSKKHKKKDKDKEDQESETASTRHEYSDSEDDQTESIASHTRIESDDEERDGLEKLNLDDSTVIQRKQYSLPHTVIIQVAFHLHLYLWVKLIFSRSVQPVRWWLKVLCHEPFHLFLQECLHLSARAAVA